MPTNPKAGTTPARAHRNNVGAKRQGPLKQSKLKAPRFNISLNSQSAATLAVRARRKASRAKAERLYGGPFPEVVKNKPTSIKPPFVSAKSQPSLVQAIPDRVSSWQSTW
jgi:hypothetical protein